MTIERYRMVRDPWNHAHMTARDNGEFVLYDDHLAALRREREPVEPVAWLVRWADGGITYLTDTKKVKLRSDQTLVPLYTTPPDHLALVAAAYRDAADACDDYPRAAPEEAEWTRYDEQIAYSKACILASTPADAEAHLTALLRAEYERGVREAAKACDWGDIYGNNAVRCILALLTQEGR